MKVGIKIPSKYCKAIVILSVLISCNNFVEVEPPITSTNGENVFNEDGTALSVLTGIYTNMSNSSIASTNGWLTNIGLLTGLTGDELKLYNTSNTTYAPYFENQIFPSRSSWSNVYRIIFITNTAIEQLPKSDNTTLSLRQQLLGEAKFIRSLCYFYLVNLYGAVPLCLSTDYQKNRVLPRANVEDVYQQIVSDLKEAQSLLSENFTGSDGISSTTERVRPSKWAATALLARVYLYQDRFNEAEIEATKLINSSNLFSLVDIKNVFLMNNKEAIWQLQPVGVESNNSANTKEGAVYNLPALGSPTSYLVTLSDTIVNSFDTNDLRRAEWIGSIVTNGQLYYFSNKYKIGYESVPTKEYSTVFRLSEQYLIRAECRIKKGNISEGIADLNLLRLRATDKSASNDKQLYQLSPNLSLPDAIQALEDERKFELFTEWGHRWFDLKRTNRISQVLSGIKKNWEDSDQLFPLPQGDVIGNPNINGHQNPGYN